MTRSVASSLCVALAFDIKKRSLPKLSFAQPDLRCSGSSTRGILSGIRLELMTCQIQVRDFDPLATVNTMQTSNCYPILWEKNPEMFWEYLTPLAYHQPL
ncbi:hypothetical protein TNCV_1483131 [Trichonephila clavipes]|nr:hypothetical protein TNCV_1483131 [Trichonephila clavipes]